MLAWNADGLAETQIIVIAQNKYELNTYKLKTKYPKLNLEVVNPKHPHVGRQAIWDTLAELRMAWPIIDGQWVTFSHFENIWLKGRLKKTIEYLKQTGRRLVLGNMRRIDYHYDNGKMPVPQFEEGHRITREIMEHPCAEYCESLEAMHWPKWLPENGVVPGELVQWHEDLFFANREWLRSWNMPWLCSDMPFQDIYDVMGTAIRHMKYSPVSRMQVYTHAQLHLSHEKHFSYYIPEIRDWFLNDPKWKHTTFWNRELWESLIANREDPEANREAMTEQRWGPGGTVARYIDALDVWLNRGNRP